MLSWFKKKSTGEEKISLPSIDVHSHLLPGLDDGVKSFEESEERYFIWFNSSSDVISRFFVVWHAKLNNASAIIADIILPAGFIILMKVIIVF